MRTTCTNRGSTLSTLSLRHIIFFASSTAAMSCGVMSIICKAMVCHRQKLCHCCNGVIHTRQFDSGTCADLEVVALARKAEQ
jgi:hypothetical protein